ncbi:hypothetical protein GCM10022268_21360 [Sphingomonas cynarae]|uniref:Lipoprotein n=1 Tax=Sphingomonas cynarae TaxID=930197 RepID=A0ABP7E4T9_9SPHN
MTRYAIAAVLLLAACGSSEDGAGNGAEEETTVAPIEKTPANLYADPGNMVVPLDPPGKGTAPAALPTPAPSPVVAIPMAFRGRWGIGLADCDAARDDAKGLMTVSADTLRFWESRAKLAAARTEGATTLVATLSFSGEGQTWREPTRMVLQDNGRSLVRDSAGDGQGGGQGGTTRYMRCPA